MLLRTAIFAAIVAVLATQIPALLHQEDGGTSPEATRQAQRTPQAPQATAPQVAALTPGSTVLAADGRGHFTGTFRLNGKSVPGMVDTGASLVAINESTARKLGYGVNGLDFRYEVNTANGKTDAALIVLDRVEIGNVRVRDVEAFVLRDKALADTLVGMSFLKKLKSYQVKGESLTLAN
ncbi:TIGR02281 family clan AA aspartic protease [Aliirhizobium terrae]|uniref:TIGR02281 family clan AA aspartic protease n=1 Tax=Terrirhizobium terrae TaxID=2926709 RepID=UPI0025772C4A|nr:TIGR02281 family clan AA aspartic protease [Rhizobium sp. CC-CFT758]WJH41900.1 TIGR02281 family clan AA aspartic protease [Rhizobium sp. CC-CFT758]